LNQENDHAAQRGEQSGAKGFHDSRLNDNITRSSRR
jgi:hypothetical protein